MNAPAGCSKTRWQMFAYPSSKIALKYSLFNLAIFRMEMPLGQTASHSLKLVQLPNPSSSIWATMARARSFRSTCPCGSRQSCEIFALVKSIAAPFGQLATQAPQPMHAAASMASSAWGDGIGILLPSGVPPVLTET